MGAAERPAAADVRDGAAASDAAVESGDGAGVDREALELDGWPVDDFLDVSPRRAVSTVAPNAVLPAPPHDFDFFQAIRLLEARFRGTPRLGERGPARLERIRLRGSTSLAFPTADVEDARWLNDPLGGPDRVQVSASFLGLTGSATPLPVLYAEQVMLEEDENPQMRELLDLFHHRLFSLLYRGWLHHRHELAFREGGTDPLSRVLLDMIGVDPATPEAQLGMPPARLMRYLGLFMMPSRPAAGLRTLLSQELQMPVRVEQLTPRWVELEPDRRYTMKATARTGGRLGRDVVVGARIRDRSGLLRLVIGPVTYAKLEGLRPDGPDGRRIAALTRLYLRLPLDVRIEVLVPAKEIPPVRLTARAPGRLGRQGSVGAPRQDPVVFRFEVRASTA